MTNNDDDLATCNNCGATSLNSDGDDCAECGAGTVYRPRPSK